MTRTKDLALEYQEQEYQNKDFIPDEDYFIAPIDLNTLQPSIATSEQIANGIIAAVREGRISPLELAVKRKCIADALDLALKNEEVKSMMVDEVEKYGKEGATCLGAKVTVINKRTYHYESDPKWKELNDSIGETLVKIKEQEKRVQAAVKNNCSLIDSDTGEMIASIVPAPETTSIAVSFKKK